ncbi:hypothetical protein PG999_014766 [Apiospora kogelbergensis]|uniref:Ankyrin n=1 Tax=Apiospora kogelbergensis TaxID=1337665 RepID=A0AAW0Q4D9_9PEZI
MFAALRMDDIQTMELLTKGVCRVSDFSLLDQRQLWTALEMNGLSHPKCAKFLLREGMTSTASLEDEVYWQGPSRPILIRDCLLFGGDKSTDEATMSFDHRLALFEEFFGERAREDDAVTVSGICIAATTGVDSLRHYMGSIQRPTFKVRKMLLEIALSESAALGWHMVIEALLEYGVNPNIPYLHKDFKFIKPIGSYPNAPFHAIWDPATRAISNHDERTLTMIYDHGGSFSNDSILTAILERMKEDQDHSILTAEQLKRLGFNPERFGGEEFVLEQFLEDYYEKRVAKLFSIWKTYDIPFQKQFIGLDLLQLALKHHCEADIIQTLLDNGLEVHSIPYGPRGETMLHYALMGHAKDRQEIVALLLREGADPTSGDPGLLLEAPLFQPSNKPGRKEENLELYCLMMRNGASWPVNPDHCHTNLLTLLIENNAADHLIFEALDHGRCDLNSHGARDNTSPLFACIQESCTELAREFLRRGAKVDTWGYFYSSSAKWTALHAACFTGAPLALIKSLLDHGAQVDARLGPHSITPLHHAASSGFLNITSLLITRGAEINSSLTFDRNNQTGSAPLGCMFGTCAYIQGRRYTALDLAAGEGHFHVVQMLYDLGGRSAYTHITAIDVAVQLARDREHIGILKFFEDRLASLDRTPDFHFESNVEELACKELF